MGVLKKTLRKLKRMVRKTPREKLLGLMPKNSTCAEIGVWKGDFSKEILKRVVPVAFHLIDPWKYQTSFGDRLYGGKVAQSQDDMNGIFEWVVSELGKKKGVVIHRDFSDKIYSSFTDEYFDWVYVDGNHYYDFVLEDLRNYASKTKKGGFLTGDDYLWSSPELEGDKPVKRAVSDFLDERSDYSMFKLIGDQFVLRRME